MSMITLRRAQKQKAKLRIGLSGPSGSGKTYSALRLALGMCPAEKICVIDTENGSADLYDHLGAYNVIPLEAPYGPERYIEAIEAAEDAGMEVIIIDSVTHEWDGKGGCLEINDKLAQAKFKGNTWGAWSQTTPRHQRFIEKITTSRCHIITTARAKTETIQTEDKKVKKVGMKEIQREGFEYELTVNFTLDRDGHYTLASKDRTGIFIDLDPFVITEETGKILADWANRGIEKITAPSQLVSSEQIKTLKELIDRKGVQDQPILDFYKIKTLKELTFKQFEHAINSLSKKPDLPAPSEDELKQSNADDIVDQVAEALDAKPEEPAKKTRKAKDGAMYKETIH